MRIEFSLREYTFSGFDAFMIMEFLSHIFGELNTLVMSYSQNLAVLPYILQADSAGSFNSTRSSGGIAAWAEAFKFPLQTHPTLSSLSEIVEALNLTLQCPSETERDYCSLSLSAAN